jgi:hypothetical protein
MDLGRRGLYSLGRSMPSKWTPAAIFALFAACGCGSDSDLVIGLQAEASAVVREAGPDAQDASVDVAEESHIGSCGDAAPREATVFEAATLDASPDGGCTNPSTCAELKAGLVHRYSFDGTGTSATDSVGTAHGTVVNTQLRGNGRLELAGGASDQYVDLPNGIVKSLTNASFEAWVTWSGCGGWERVFDFGDTDVGENLRRYASTTLYLTPQSMNGRDVMFGAFKRADQAGLNETRAASNLPLQTNAMVQIVLVVDDGNNVMSLYRNGAFENAAAFSDALSMLNDVNVWLGRSQYVADPSFSGTFHEFRIYDIALTKEQVQVSFVAGPDPAFLD